MKRAAALIVSLVLGVATLGTLSGCGAQSTKADQKVTEIRVAFNQNENHPQYKAMKQLGEEFEKATNGRYHMTIYANGVLGDQPTMAEYVRSGALQMAIVPSSVPEGYDDNFAIVGAPYLYGSMDDMREALEQGVYDDLFAETKAYNFQTLTIYTAGVRNVYAKKAINSAADLKGMIIRVNDSSTYIKMTELMGGSGSVMAQSEVYTALQQGVIDAAENSELVYRDFKHGEVAPYYVYTNHIVHPDVVIASNDFMDSLSESDREIFKELVMKSSEYEFDTFADSVAEAHEELVEQGVNFCYPDVEEFRSMCQPLLDEIANRSDVTKAVYDKVTAIREANAAK